MRPVRGGRQERGTRGKQPARGSPRSDPSAQTYHSTMAALKKDDPDEAVVVHFSTGSSAKTMDKRVSGLDLDETPSEDVATFENEVEDRENQYLEGEALEEEEFQDLKMSLVDKVTEEEKDEISQSKLGEAHSESDASVKLMSQIPGDSSEAEKGDTGDVIIIDDESDNETASKKMKTDKQTSSDSVSYWRVRICPIHFDDFCEQKDAFKKILKMTLSTEFRLSQVLLTRLAKNWFRTQPPHNFWLPSENLFRRGQTACTLGMLEMKVINSSLVDLIKCIHSISQSKDDRVRFELNRISKKDALKSEFKEDMAEHDDKLNETTVKETATKLDDLNTTFSEDLTVNFALRFKPLCRPTKVHEPGHIKMPQDNCIFIANVPDEVPDFVLEAIFQGPIAERKKGNDSTGTAILTVLSELGAQGYMELFDGILVNSAELELSTTLGTLSDARKQIYKLEKFAQDSIPEEKRMPEMPSPATEKLQSASSSCAQKGPSGGQPSKLSSGGSTAGSSMRGEQTGTSIRGGQSGTSVRGRQTGTSVRGGQTETYVRGGRTGASIRGGRTGASIRGGQTGTSVRGGHSGGLHRGGQLGGSVGSKMPRKRTRPSINSHGSFPASKQRLTFHQKQPVARNRRFQQSHHDRRISLSSRRIPDLMEIPIPPVGSHIDNNVHVMNSLQAQVLATQRDLSILQERARRAQIQLIEEQDLRQNFVAENLRRGLHPGIGSFEQEGHYPVSRMDASFRF